MTILRRFGCGCVGIPLPHGRQIVVKSCYDTDDSPALNIVVGERIKPENLPGVELTESSQGLIFDEINRLMDLGRRFESIQRLLK